MKTIIKSGLTYQAIILIAFIFNFSAAFGQNSKDEREAARKRIKASNISSITVTKYDYKFGTKEEEGIKLKLMEYDDDGNITVEIRYKYGEDEFRKEAYKYNKQANEIEITTIDADDIIKKVVKEKYNKSGDMTEEAEYGPSGDLKYKIIYDYNSSNKLIKETKYNNSGNVQKFTEYIYDGSSNLIEKISKSNDADVIDKYTYKYDASNNRIEETVYKRDGNINESYIFTYEGTNRIEEVKQDADGKMVYKVAYKYDGSGNKTERTLFTSDGETISLKVNYKYDKNGNLKEELESDKIGENKKVIIYEF